MFSKRNSPGDSKLKRNKLLILVLYIKIIFTVFLWAIPALFIPETMLQSIEVTIISPKYPGKLLGAAYIALAIGYFDGLLRARKGIQPTGTIIMGIISNGAATIILILYAFPEIKSDSSPVETIFIYFSTAITALLTAGLIITAFPKKRSE